LVSTLAVGPLGYAQPKATGPAGQAPSPAATPADASADAKEEARRLFENGLQLVKDGAFDAALAAFRRSIALFPTRSASQNAAIMLRKLARYDEAADAWEALLKRFPDLSPEERAFIKKEQDELTAYLGEIDLRVTEPDAIVIIDGIERGRAPLDKPVRVAAGSRSVRVYKEGFLPFEQRVDVVAKSSLKLTATLGALLRGGRLRVTEDRGDKVDVFVDKTPVGKTPWEGTVGAGKHTVFLRNGESSGSPPATVDVRQNQLSTLALLAEPLLCRIRVEPTPINATVAFDGVDVGQGVWESPVRCGGHEIEVAAEGFLPLRRVVAVAAQSPLTLKESLERDPASKLFRAENPPRIVVGLRAHLLITPTLGGPLAESCGDGCSQSPPLGFMAQVFGGYRLGSGLGFGASASYLSLQRTYEDRRASLVPEGLLEHTGTAKDAVRFHGPAIGGYIGIEKGKTIQFGARLGVGVMFALWSDARSAALRTPKGTPYNTAEVSESGITFAPYIQPEAQVGVALTKSLTVSLGVSATALFGLGSAEWTDKNVIPAGDRTSPEYRENGGVGKYGTQPLAAGAVLSVSPVLGAQIAF
jgi:hypothetical protein